MPKMLQFSQRADVASRAGVLSPTVDDAYRSGACSDDQFARITAAATDLGLPVPPPRPPDMAGMTIAEMIRAGITPDPGPRTDAPRNVIGLSHEDYKVELERAQKNLALLG